MEKEDKFVVAIEIGSSKVTGLVGTKDPDGHLQIRAYAEEPSTAFIRKGRINNVNKMTQCIKNIKDTLEKKLGKGIGRVYVGIGGMGMHTVSNTIVRHFDARTEITQDMIATMEDENRNSTSPDRIILESVPQEYRLGTQLQTDPVGVPTENIEGHFLNIVASSTVREEISNCFRNAEVSIVDLPIAVLSLANSMLSDGEKSTGCVFVDMGAETTSVAVYKNNLLRHLAIIPLGGANVNKDIKSALQVEDDEAEELKLKYGSAFVDLDEEEYPPIPLRGDRTASYEEFTGLVEARIEEIIANIKNQIALSGYTKKNLIGGIIVTGGASRMKNIEKAFVRNTEFEKIRFVYKTNVQLRDGGAASFNSKGEFNTAIALLDENDENCYGGPIGEVKPDLFKEDKKEEAPQPTPEDIERQKAEEEEARRKAEEQRKRDERKNKWKNLIRKAIEKLESTVSEKED